MKKAISTIFILFVLTAWGQIVRAQNKVDLEGKVIDSETGDEIPGAMLSVLNADPPIGTISDDEGKFQLFQVESGKILTIRLISHREMEIIIPERPPKPFVILLDPVPVHTITAPSPRARWLKLPASMEMVEKMNLERGATSSLAGGLNQIPGVQMDERGPGGSHRLSIRGSLLRSPFGVRNVKAYWNAIPLTSPDGSTPLELTDASLTQRIEVQKGPNGSLYGAGTGGIMQIFTPRYKTYRKRVSIGGEYGNWGYLRNRVRFDYVRHNTKLQIGLIDQHLAGYRQQEANRKTMLYAMAEQTLDHGHSLDLMAWLYDGYWELPGALSPALVDQDPRMALPYSVDQQASVKRQRARLGFQWKTEFDYRFRQETSVYGNITGKDNPYGTSTAFQGYNRERAAGLGGRTAWQYNILWNKTRLNLTWGGELQSEWNDFQEFDNQLGQPGPLRFSGLVRSTQSLGFAQAELNLPWQFSLVLGSSLNGLTYDLQDHYLADSIDNSLNRSFAPVVAPRIALRKDLGDNFSLHAQYSQGFAPPTLWELQLENAALNTTLTAERSTNYELGCKALFFRRLLMFSLDVYYTPLKNAIIPYYTVSAFTEYQNTGDVQQAGAEFMFLYEYHAPLGEDSRPKFPIWLIRPWLSGSLNRYHYGDYIKTAQDFTGNQVPGIPSVTLNGGVDAKFPAGFSTHISGRYLGSIPLDDANQDYAAPVFLLNARLNYYTEITHRHSLNLYLGGSNLLNAHYSSFYALNAFGMKYYNPAPTMTIFGGFELNLGDVMVNPG
ncbi:MAG: TonB-dependent receptor plug domain-containing protein [Bacteroidia bacterium]|nr:TonB-dependent receptor plug domain-containing protein [Bacteroidia bacterium]